MVGLRNLEFTKHKWPNHLDAFLNDGDHCGASLNEVVDPQQLKIVVLHFDIIQVLEAVVLLYAVKAVAAQHLPVQRVDKLCPAQRDRE